jgi:hypothetical protein
MNELKRYKSAEELNNPYFVKDHKDLNKLDKKFDLKEGDEAVWIIDRTGCPEWWNGERNYYRNINDSKNPQYIWCPIKGEDGGLCFIDFEPEYSI